MPFSISSCHCSPVLCITYACTCYRRLLLTYLLKLGTKGCGLLIILVHTCDISYRIMYHHCQYMVAHCTSGAMIDRRLMSVLFHRMIILTVILAHARQMCRGLMMHMYIWPWHWWTCHTFVCGVWVIFCICLLKKKSYDKNTLPLTTYDVASPLHSNNNIVISMI